MDMVSRLLGVITLLAVLSLQSFNVNYGLDQLVPDNDDDIMKIATLTYSGDVKEPHFHRHDHHGGDGDELQPQIHHDDAEPHHHIHDGDSKEPHHHHHHVDGKEPQIHEELHHHHHHHVDGKEPQIHEELHHHHHHVDGKEPQIHAPELHHHDDAGEEPHIHEELHHHHHHHHGDGNEPHIHHHHHGDGEEPHIHHDHGDVIASNVLVLDASNFTQTVADHSFIVVEFYAPWCGYCMRLAPQYEKAASLLRAHDPPIVLAKVDATDQLNEDLADEFHINGIPALKIIENNGDLVREYEGPNDADGIVSYLKKQVEPASQEIVNAEEGHQLVNENDAVVVVGVFSSYECEEFRNFTLVASELRSLYEFRHTMDASFLPTKSTPLIGSPIIRVFKNFDEGYDDLMDFETRSIKKFLEEVSVPYIVLFKKDPVHKEHLSKIFAKLEGIRAFLFVDAMVENDQIKNVFEELAKQYRTKGMRFLVADTEDGLRAFDFFGVKKEKLPCVVLEGSDEKKYMLDKAQLGKIGEWFKDYFDGKVSEFYKSEPVPEKNNEPIKTVVLDTFDEMVLNSGKNVLVEFYAPWCAHCIRLAPIINEVAVALQSNPHVMISKYDATANDIKDDRFDVRAFPTIYLHSASGKVIPYEGDLDSTEDLINFIDENKDSLPGKGEIIQEKILEGITGLGKDEL